MQKLNITISIFILVLLLSCKDTAKKDGVTDFSPETPDYNIDNMGDDPLPNDNVTIMDEYLTLHSQDMKNMYQQLKMTPAQIKDFEQSYNSRLREIRKSHESRELDETQVQREKDSILKNILDIHQYRQYQTLKMENTAK